MLNEWTVEYIKHKDVFARSIVELTLKDNIIYVKHKKHNHNFLILEKLDDKNKLFDALKSIKTDKITLVTTNSKSNFEFLKANWKEFSEFDSQFNVIFVNPKSVLEHKWIVFPMTHQKISEDVNLGLQSLYDTVEPA